MKVKLVPYSREYLDLSWSWLQDAEIKRLTMTPDFTREDQLRFFESLPLRPDYRLWGVEADGRSIGVAGLKNVCASRAEYWGYIGEKTYWGKRIGEHIMQSIENIAFEMGLTHLDLRVWKDNNRAIALYLRMGYSSATYIKDDVIQMTKDIVSQQKT